MAIKTKIVTAGSTWTVPDDFVAFSKIRGISAGEGGHSGGRGGYGGTYNEVTDFTGFSVAAGNVLDIHIGETEFVTVLSGIPGDPTGGTEDWGDFQTWIKDNNGTVMLNVPLLVWVPFPNPPYSEALSFQTHPGQDDPVPFDIDVISPGGTIHVGQRSGGAAGSERRFIDDPLFLDEGFYGEPGFADPRAAGGGGGCILDPDGVGWPNWTGDGIIDAIWPSGGLGANTDLGTGGGTHESPHGTNGGGGRGGDDPLDGDPAKTFGGNGGSSQVWQDSDTGEWAGPGGGGGGAGVLGLTEGGDGGLYGGGGGGGGDNAAFIVDALENDLHGRGGTGLLVIEYLTSDDSGTGDSEGEGTFEDTVWPVTFAARAMGWIACSAPVSGGQGLAGVEHVEETGNGYWKLVLDGIPIRTKADALYFREVEAKLTGRIGVAVLTVCDGKYAPWPPDRSPIEAYAAETFAVGATSGSIEMVNGAEPQPGMQFSTGERTYRIATVGAVQSGDVYPITFWPKVREMIADLEPLEFVNLKLRCRLEDPAAMHLALDTLRFGFPSLTFVEDVLN